jgi:AcrR family transcriptional regulator
MTTSDMTPAALRPPRQDRSRASLERILIATETLIETKRFEDVTIGEIVRLSGSSVGAFYSRFEGKTGLLPCLYERYDAWIGRVSERLFAPKRWERLGLDARVRRIAALAVRAYRRRRGILRSIVLHARAHPEDITMPQREHRQEQYRRLSELLLERRSEISHPQPEEAVRFALLMLGAVARERILFGDAPHPSSVPISDRRLAIEIAGAMLAYLTQRPGPSGARGTPS